MSAVIAYLRPLRGWAAALVLLLVGAILLVTSRSSGAPQRHITAHFTTAPGLYVGNLVDILGMPVGKVTEVIPSPGGVDVQFRVPTDLDLPVGVQAMLMAPNLISDRYIELTPAYTAGARFTSSEIATDHTRVPVSADEIIKSISDLSAALGPNGANAKGDLSALLHQLATTFGPDGKPLNDTLTNFGQALGAIGSQSSDLTTVFNSLGTLTQAASQNLDNYTAFSSNLAAVSTSLASEKGDIATALSTLQQALGQLSTFVTDNAATLAGSVDGLNTFAAALARQQQGLAQTYQTLPIALQNLQQAVDRSDPNNPALRVRYDPSLTSQAFGQAVCGNPTFRLLTLTLAAPQNLNGGVYDGKRQEDFLCGLMGVTQNLPIPSGAGGPSLPTLVGVAK